MMNNYDQTILSLIIINIGFGIIAVTLGSVENKESGEVFSLMTAFGVIILMVLILIKMVRNKRG